MPGPTSDSYDPEFGTGDNANSVRNAILKAIDKLTAKLGPDLKNIVVVADGPKGKVFNVKLSEKDLRALRFAALRSLDSI